jgi:hypothetical protein
LTGTDVVATPEMFMEGAPAAAAGPRRTGARASRCKGGRERRRGTGREGSELGGRWKDARRRRENKDVVGTSVRRHRIIWRV